MQALKYIYEGDVDKALDVIKSIPDTTEGEVEMEKIILGATTLSDLARAERGNRRTRREQARRRR